MERPQLLICGAIKGAKDEKPLILLGSRKIFQECKSNDADGNKMLASVSQREIIICTGCLFIYLYIYSYLYIFI